MSGQVVLNQFLLIDVSLIVTNIYLLMIYEINHIWTAEMQKWNEEMIVAVNAIYAIV